MWLKKKHPTNQISQFFLACCGVMGLPVLLVSCLRASTFFFPTTVEFILNVFFFFRAVCKCTAAAYILSCFDGTDTADTSAGSTALQ